MNMIHQLPIVLVPLCDRKLLTERPNKTLQNHSCISTLYNVVQHHMTHDKIEHGNWKPDGLSNNLQWRVHGLTVSCSQVLPTSYGHTPFCHIFAVMLHQSAL